MIIPKFMKSMQTFEHNIRTWETASADLDSDGDLDLVFASMESPSLVLFNDGEGKFKSSGQPFPRDMHGIDIGDIDLDGDLDLFFAPIRENRPNPIFLNDGQGNFVQSNTGLLLEPSEKVQLQDIDNDGDLDAYLWYRNILCINDGKGLFRKENFPMSGIFRLSDLNVDGVVDAYCVSWGKGIDFYLNDGTGAFDLYFQYPDNHLNMCYLDFGDVDNDGDKDLIYCGYGGEFTKPGGVLLNDGEGRFSDSGEELPTVKYSHIGIGDLNNDSYLDLIITQRDGPASIWMNNGDGMFFDSDIRLGEGTGWNNCLIVDFDRDGDMDIFITNFMQSNHGLWFNQLISNRE